MSFNYLPVSITVSVSGTRAVMASPCGFVFCFMVGAVQFFNVLI